MHTIILAKYLISLKTLDGTLQLKKYLVVTSLKFLITFY